MQHTAYINEAYRVLTDPLARATYLLGMRGFEVTDLPGTSTDTAFLYEQMELREELDALRGDTDPAGRLERLVQRIDASTAQLVRMLSDAFASATPEGLAMARDLVPRLQFLDRIRRSADDLAAELDEQD